MTLAERIDKYSLPEPNSGCILWIGATAHGYGKIQIAGKSRLIHRIVYENTVGPIPPELQIDHLCRVRCCINPKHMELVTIKTNVLRVIGPTAVNKTKTHCKRGHPLAGENLKPVPGGRACRICAKLKQDEWVRNNPQKVKEKFKRWYERHKEQK